MIIIVVTFALAFVVVVAFFYVSGPATRRRDLEALHEAEEAGDLNSLLGMSGFAEHSDCEGFAAGLRGSLPDSHNGRLKRRESPNEACDKT